MPSRRPYVRIGDLREAQYSYFGTSMGPGIDLHQGYRELRKVASGCLVVIFRQQNVELMLHKSHMAEQLSDSSKSRYALKGTEDPTASILILWSRGED